MHIHRLAPWAFAALFVFFVAGCGEAPEADVGASAEPAPAHGDVQQLPTRSDRTIDGWIDAVEEALELARSTQRPLLVYVCPEAKGCPAARHLNAQLLDDETAAALAPEIVPLRLCLGEVGDDATQTLLRRMELLLLPALAVLTPSGEVAHRQYAGLYPAFDEKGGVLPGSWGRMLTREDLRDIVRTTIQRRADLVCRAELFADTDTPEQRVELAVILEELGRAGESIALLEGVRDDLGAARVLAPLYEHAARPAAAAELYERLVRDHPDHAEAEGWRYHAAHLRLAEQPLRAGEVPVAVTAARRELETLRASARSRPVRILSALSLAERLKLEGGADAALREQLTWLAAQADVRVTLAVDWTPAMLFRLHGLEALPDPVLLRRSEAHCRLLLEAFPDSFEAQQVKHGMLGLLRCMAEQTPAQSGG